MLEVESTIPPLTPSSEEAVDVEAMDASLPLNISTDSGDYETPTVDMMQKARIRRQHTRSGVTAGARKVLERFLKMSEARRYLTDIGSGNEVEHQYATVSEIAHDLQPTPYQPMGSDDESLVDKSEFLKHHRLPAAVMSSLEPEYVDCQMLVNMTLSSHSQGSHRSRSPCKLIAPDMEHPPKVKSTAKVKTAKKTSLEEGSSSSSTEDYEYTENELLNRKKKSFFRWASERAQSFRRQMKKTSTTTEVHTKFANPTPGEQRPLTLHDFGMKSETPLPLPPQTAKHGTAAGSRISLQRDGSDKSKSNSSDVTSETALADLAPHSLLHAHTGTLDMLVEEKKKKSPLPWKRSDTKDKKKDVIAVDEKIKDNRGVFEGILRQFRKGSAKLKRKGIKAFAL